MPKVPAFYDTPSEGSVDCLHVTFADGVATEIASLCETTGLSTEGLLIASLGLLRSAVKAQQRGQRTVITTRAWWPIKELVLPKSSQAVTALPNPTPIVIRQIPEEPHFFRPVSAVSSARFIIVSSCYLVLIVCATVTAVLAVVALFDDTVPLSKTVLEHFGSVLGVLVSSGGIGTFLFKIDRTERHSMRCDRMLDHLMKMPITKATEKAIIDLVKKMIDS